MFDGTKVPVEYRPEKTHRERFAREDDEVLALTLEEWQKTLPNKLKEKALVQNLQTHPIFRTPEEGHDRTT